MTDTTLRAAERRWQETGGDAERGSYIRALTRVGEPVPYSLRVLESKLYTSLRRNKFGLEEYRHKTTGMVFVLIPAGEFMMGPTHSATSEEDGPPPQVRRVFDEPFLIAKYPWTGKEWYRVTGEFPSHFPTRAMVAAAQPEYEVIGVSQESGEPLPIPAAIRMELRDSDGHRWGEHPVESVSWDRCREIEDWINRVDFARQFNTQFQLSDGSWTQWVDYDHGVAETRDDGEVALPMFGALVFSKKVEPLYQAWLWNAKGERAGFQLPSESQWEYAARAGTTTRYPNGDTDDDLEKIAWFGGDWDDGHKAVGLKESNNWGLHDNCGNVFEWTRCMWRQEVEEAPVNGFLAVGEECSDPTVTKFLCDTTIQERVSAALAAPPVSPTPESGSQSSNDQQTSESEQSGEEGSSDPTSASLGSPQPAQSCDGEAGIAKPFGTGPIESTPTTQLEPGSSGEVGDSDFLRPGQSTSISQDQGTAPGSQQDGSSTPNQTSAGSVAPSSEGTKGLLSSIRDTFSRLSSHFRPQPESGATSPSSRATPGTPGQEKRTSSPSSSTPAMPATLIGSMDSDRPGGAGDSGPFVSRSRLKTCSDDSPSTRLPSETSSSINPDTETPSSKSTQQTTSGSPSSSTPTTGWQTEQSSSREGIGTRPQDSSLSPGTTQPTQTTPTVSGESEQPGDLADRYAAYEYMDPGEYRNGYPNPYSDEVISPVDGSDPTSPPVGAGTAPPNSPGTGHNSSTTRQQTAADSEQPGEDGSPDPTMGSPSSTPTGFPSTALQSSTTQATSHSDEASGPDSTTGSSESQTGQSAEGRASSTALDVTGGGTGETSGHRGGGSDRPGGAGSDVPLALRSESSHSSEINSSETGSPGSTGSSPNSGTEPSPPTTHQGSSSSEAQDSTCPSPPNLAADIDPVVPEQNAPQQELPGEGGDSDFPSSMRSEMTSSARSTGTSSATSPQSVTRSSTEPGGTTQTGSSQDQTRSDQTRSDQSESSEVDSGTATKISSSGTGRSQEDSQITQQDSESVGERGDSDFTPVTLSPVNLPSTALELQSSEVSAGSVIQPTHSSEILTAMSEMRTTLLSERPGRSTDPTSFFSNKWSLILKGVEGSYAKDVAAIMLENQTQHLKRVRNEVQDWSRSNFLRLSIPIIQRPYAMVNINAMVNIGDINSETRRYVGGQDWEGNPRTNDRRGYQHYEPYPFCGGRAAWRCR